MRVPNLIISTFILFLSNFMVRVMGFLYKVFLSNNINESWLGIYHIIFNFLMICLALTTTGIPTTLSCLISKKNALKDKHSTNVYFISSLYIAFFISAFISIFISINSKFFSSLILGNENLYMLILSICPAVIVITLSNILRGYYYGLKNATIPAIGQILEQISKILFVYMVITFINNKSMNCYFALLGISIGESINILFMSISLFKNKSINNTYTISVRDFYNSSFETIKLSLPITCNKVSSILLHSMSSIIIPSRLVLSGISYKASLSIYGVINGMVMPFIYIPFTVSSALVVNLIPSISQELALRNKSLIKKKILFSIALTSLVGASCSTLFYFYSYEICNLFFDNIFAGKYLKSLFLLPLFMSLNQTLSAILHSVGKELVCSCITISGMIIQFILIYILLPLPNINIHGYIFALTFISFITCFFNSVVLIKYIKNI